MGVELQLTISVDIYTYELNIILQNDYKIGNKFILSLCEQNNQYPLVASCQVNTNLLKEW